MTPTSSFVLICVSYAIIAFHLYDWLCNLSFEIEYIWSKTRSSIVKWQYLLSRYLGIIAQVANTTLLVSLDSVSSRHCWKWRILQVLGSHVLLLSLNVRLTHRLVALYGRSPHVIGFLCILVLIELGHGIFYYFQVIHRLEGRCLMTHFPLSGIYVVVAHIMVQATLWTLTMLKSQRKTAPLLLLITRDGSLVFVASFFTCVPMLINALRSKENFDITYFFDYIFPVASTVDGLANCHIIKNLTMMERNLITPSSAELTSVVPDDDN